MNEARQALANLAAELEVAGGRLGRTAACDVTVKSAEELPAVKAAVAAVWPVDAPVVSTAVVAGLAGNGTVEIKCVGYAGAALQPLAIGVGMISV
eukprot:1322363-Amphidinium_carterae.1